jgi:hypothetical protein
MVQGARMTVRFFALDPADPEKTSRQMLNLQSTPDGRVEPVAIRVRKHELELTANPLRQKTLILA